MKNTQYPVIYGKSGKRKFFLTTMKAQQLIDVVNNPPEHTKYDREMDYLATIIIAIQGGEPEFIELEVKDELRHTRMPEFQMGILQVSETAVYHLIKGFQEFKSARAKNEAQAKGETKTEAKTAGDGESDPGEELGDDLRDDLGNAPGNDLAVMFVGLPKA